MPSTYHRNRFLLLCGFVVALVVVWFAGKWFGIPPFPGHTGSLLVTSAPLTGFGIIALTTWLSVAVCTLIAGSVRTDAGLCCAAVGLMAMSARCGPIRYALFGSGASVFYRLALELALLFIVLVGGLIIVRRMAKLGLVRVEDDFTPDDECPLDQKLIATATHACAMATLVLILCRTDQKAQCLAAVGVSAFIASLIAGMVAPVRPAFWYWISPVFVGALGYLWAALSPGDLSIGRSGGYFQSLARPVPLDYASLGVAGAMLGYWVARAWQRQRGDADDESAPDKPGQTAQSA